DSVVQDERIFANFDLAPQDHLRAHVADQLVSFLLCCDIALRSRLVNLPEPYGDEHRELTGWVDLFDPLEGHHVRAAELRFPEEAFGNRERDDFVRAVLREILMRHPGLVARSEYHNLPGNYHSDKPILRS
ncbi:MAG: hypothetical protein L0220_30890, partial [Acidobacteria bacterium]|nr:hypothetical protein [Acidobacteriota bacterium]